MVPSRLELIPLGQAALCANCQHIGRNYGRYCAGCGSENLIDLATLLKNGNGGAYEIEKTVWLDEISGNDKIC
jgi:predicted amidophosphoribosyltransferase